MPAHCSLIIVNYRSAPLAIEAARTARASSAARIQVVIIDNSADAREAEMLKPVADVFIDAETNLGYGAAINRARRQCDGSVLIAANPDIRFCSGSIDRLVDTDADVAGPALYWDNACEWRLPPSDLHTTAEVVDAVLASRSRFWFRRRDMRRMRKRFEFWSLRDPTPVPAISGAVMAIRASAFDRLRGFDERFRLYFEEIDFVRRLGKGIVYVPPAKVRHIYNQSAGPSSAAAAEYARSEAAYLAKWSSFAFLAKRLERPVKAGAAVPIDTRLELDREGVLVEASPLPTFDTAAGHFPKSRHVEIPPEVWEAYKADALYLRVIDPRSRTVIGTWVKTKIAA